MNLTDFYALLAATPRDWEMDQEGQIRRYLSSEGETLQCPISALRAMPVNQAHYVAGQLHLSSALTTAIIDAADDRDDHNPNIRAELLRACALTSQPTEKEKP